MKKLQDFNFKGKNVLVRCDFNVPLSSQGQVLDDFRIKATLPTIEYLIERKAKVILMSHLERRDEAISLKHIVPKLEELLGKKIKFLVNYLEKDAKREIEKVKLGEVILLENLRFHREEKENNKPFAKKISKLGDFFVNEAFSVCHRNHASLVSIPEYLPKAAGILLEREIKVLSQLLKKFNRPFVAIIGGIKVSSKIKTILNILKIADHLLLGSKIGEVILAEKEILIGRRLPKEKLVQKLNLTDPKVHLPLDGVMALRDLKEGSLRKAGLGTLRRKEEVFDIGPETIKIFKEMIKTAKTILWNGPLGMFEDKRFELGTKEIADSIVRNYSAFKVAGGGETILAIRKFKLEEKFDFLSSGGGAMLQFLAGEKLPGIEALY